MNHIFIDFEMQPIAKEYKKERKICQREIIEFGAIMLDENLDEIGFFKEYVKPQYTKQIYSKISILTGITKAKLVGASKFNEVFTKFMEWCESFDEQFYIYAWSKSDFEQITKEMQLKETIETNTVKMILENWIDFQSEYCNLIQSERLLSLENALESIGIRFSGKMHDALNDARNTAELFRFSRNQDDLLKIRSLMKCIIDKDNETCCCTLGDMIDFGSICFA